MLLSLPLSLLVISVARIFYRPLIGIPLVIAAAAGFVFLIRTLMAQKKKRAGLGGGRGNTAWRGGRGKRRVRRRTHVAP